MSWSTSAYDGHEAGMSLRFECLLRLYGFRARRIPTDANSKRTQCAINACVEAAFDEQLCDLLRRFFRIICGDLNAVEARGGCLIGCRRGAGGG